MMSKGEEEAVRDPRFLAGVTPFTKKSHFVIILKDCGYVRACIHTRSERRTSICKYLT